MWGELSSTSVYSLKYALRTHYLQFLDTPLVAVTASGGFGSPTINVLGQRGLTIWMCMR
jgi:hypothetical protein